MDIFGRRLEYSPLSGLVTQDGVTVEVLIYRFLGTVDSSSLEVADQEGGYTVWTESFSTDQATHEGFLRGVDAGGMSEGLF